MSNNNSNLSDMQIIANSCKNLDFTYVFVGADGSIFNYSLTLSKKKPLTFVGSWDTTKTVKGVKEGIPIEILQIEMDAKDTGLGTVSTEILDKQQLPSKAVITMQVEGREKMLSKHSDVVLYLAIPYWMKEASESVTLNQIAASWLVVVNLLRQCTLAVDDSGDINERATIAPFEQSDYWLAVIESAKQARNNPKLLEAVSMIPDEFEYLMEDYRYLLKNAPKTAKISGRNTNVDSDVVEVIPQNTTTTDKFVPETTTPTTTRTTTTKNTTK